MEFIGKNTDFKVIWNCTDQNYKVYHKDKYINIVAYRYRNIATYLN